MLWVAGVGMVLRQADPQIVSTGLASTRMSSRIKKEGRQCRMLHKLRYVALNYEPVSAGPPGLLVKAVHRAAGLLGFRWIWVGQYPRDGIGIAKQASLCWPSCSAPPSGT